MTHTPAYRAGTDDDRILVSWYLHLYETGDLHTTFMPSMHSLSGFMREFTASELVMALDDDSAVPWAAVWVESMCGTPFIGVWIAEAFRGSFRAAKFLLTWNDRTTTAYPTILAITRQPTVVELTQHLGYTNHGWIPGLWAGYPAYLLSSTKESRDGWRQRRRRITGIAQTHTR